MKILSQLPISMPRETYGPYYDLLTRAYDKFRDEKTKVTIKDVPSGISNPALMTFTGIREINATENARAMIRSAREDFDAVAGACYFDCGIKTAKSLLSIPVVGAAEAAMYLASMMGTRFAVVTSEPDWIEEITHYLTTAGFSDLAIPCRPVRAMTMPLQEMFHGIMNGKYDDIRDDFVGRAEECTEDGAEVIIAGCGLISPVFSTTGPAEIEGAPIIDPMVASFKIAEMMAGIQKSGMKIQSRRGIFQAPSPVLRESGLKELSV